MGLNPFKAEDKRWGAQGLFTPVDTGFRSISVTFSDWSEAVPLSNEERQAIADVRRGSRQVKLSAAKQRELIRKAKKAEAEVKKAKKAAAERAKMDKKTGTRRH